MEPLMSIKNLNTKAYFKWKLQFGQFKLFIYIGVWCQFSVNNNYNASVINILMYNIFHDNQEH